MIQGISIKDILSTTLPTIQPISRHHTLSILLFALPLGQNIVKCLPTIGMSINSISSIKRLNSSNSFPLWVPSKPCFSSQLLTLLKSPITHRYGILEEDFIVFQLLPNSPLTLKITRWISIYNDNLLFVATFPQFFHSKRAIPPKWII